MGFHMSAANSKWFNFHSFSQPIVIWIGCLINTVSIAYSVRLIMISSLTALVSLRPLTWKDVIFTISFCRWQFKMVWTRFWHGLYLVKNVSVAGLMRSNMILKLITHLSWLDFSSFKFLHGHFQTNSIKYSTPAPNCNHKTSPTMIGSKTLILAIKMAAVFLEMCIVYDLARSEQLWLDWQQFGRRHVLP